MNIKEIATWSAAKRAALFGGAALVLALTMAVLWWVLAGGRDQVLFADLREADAAEIVVALNEWKVPHKITDGGSVIRVDADQVYEVRMRLVSAGVPKGGHVGFELFDDADFGVTEFAQRVNFQRALQGELERTIAAMPGVANARVHLTIRRAGLFVGQSESSKASVAVTLEPGVMLARGQVNGIRSLVAAAVEGLPSEQVTVLDSSGALLAGNSLAGQALASRSDDEQQLEAQLQGRVHSLLAEVLPDGGYHVSVDARLNFDSVRQINERPLARAVGDDAVLVRRRVNSVNAPEGAGRSHSQEDAEYAHGTAREEIARAPGRIEKLSIAVVLPATLDEFEVERLSSLIAAAAGLDEARGDRLEVSRLGVQRLTTEDMQIAPRVPDASPLVVRQGVERFASWAWVLFGAIGLAIGAMLMAATQRRPKRLTHAEREAVVAKLEGWLAEGRLPS